MFEQPSPKVAGGKGQKEHALALSSEEDELKFLSGLDDAVYLFLVVFLQTEKTHDKAHAQRIAQ